jgi:outer membrane protein OmpA-like peptidoglycan-associated protein
MKLSRLLGLIFFVALLAAVSFAQNKYELDGNHLKVAKPVTFVGATDKLEPASDAALQFVKEYLTDKKYISTMRIEVHFRAGIKDAQTLSEKRALSIANWLVKNGVDCHRLFAVGFGTTKPIADPPQMFENDRVEFQNAALAGHAIGGLPLDGGGKSAGAVCPAN